MKNLIEYYRYKKEIGTATTMSFSQVKPSIHSLSSLPRYIYFEYHCYLTVDESNRSFLVSRTKVIMLKK